MADLNTGIRMSPQFLEVGEGKHPVFPRGLYPAPYLPILEEVYYGQSGLKVPVVIKAGMIVGIDKWGFLVPATGYYATGGVSMTYTSTDISYKVADLDGFNTWAASNVYGNDRRRIGIGYTAVSSAGASTATVVVKPLGIATADVFAHPEVLRKAGWDNFAAIQPAAVLTSGHYVYPVVSSAMALDPGTRLTVANPTSNTFSAANKDAIGKFAAFSSLTFANIAALRDGMDYVFGKALYIDKLNVDAIGIDKRGLLPGAGFQELTSTSSDPMYLEHLRTAASVAYNSETAYWALHVLVGRAI